MFIINDDGSIDLIRGDSGDILIKGIKVPSSATNIKLYFSIYSEETDDNEFVNEMSFNVSNNNGVIENKVIHIPPSFTDKFYIESGKDVVEYYYSFKICYRYNGNEYEETITKDGNPETKMIIRVYRKRAEGELNNG